MDKRELQDVRDGSNSEPTPTTSNAPLPSRTTVDEVAALPRFAPREGIRVLHISDLHIGRRAVRGESLDNELWRRIWDAPRDGSPMSEGSGLCVVTGDLANSPNKKVFQRIKRELQRHMGEGRWLVVPGNHDRKRIGNFGCDTTKFEGVFEDWKAPWWRRDAPLIIVPLDSNPERKTGRRVRWTFDLARGHLGVERNRIKRGLDSVEEQVRLEFEADLLNIETWRAAGLSLALEGSLSRSEVEYARSGSLDNDDPTYKALVRHTARLLARQFMARAVRCLLMHHHPVGVTDTEGHLPTDQDIFLALTDAGEFLQEARLNHINLVCHGHKHMPFRMLLGLPGEQPEFLGIVGAGSTTGRRSPQACANILDVSPQGIVDVTVRYTKERERWQDRRHRLQLRSWAGIKSQLARVADEEHLVSVGDMMVYAWILPTGDAVYSFEYRNVRFKEQAVQSRHVNVPVAVWCFTQLRVPTVRGFVREPDRPIRRDDVAWRGDAGCSVQRQQGFARFQANRHAGVEATFGVQTIVYCAFATNEWQFGCMYPDELDPEEYYYWQCSLPIRNRLVFSLTAHSGMETSDEKNATRDLLFKNPRARHWTIDDWNLRDEAPYDDPEESEVFVSLSPGSQSVQAVATSPIWGSTYGVAWKWNKERGTSPFARRIEDRRTELERLVDSDERDQLPRELQDLWSEYPSLADQGLEACIYLIHRTGGDERAKLVQLCWNARLAEQDLHNVELPFGAGVAGRAAWLRQTVAWAEPRGTEDAAEEQWGDCYVSVRDKVSHLAIIAVPIPLRSDAPLAVLSIATQERNQFVSDTRTFYRTKHRPANLQWLHSLAVRAGALVGEATIGK